MIYIRHKEHLKFMRHLLKNWDYFTQSNDGIFINKIRIFTASKEFIMTKPQLELHILRTKLNIRKLLKRRNK